MHPHDGLLTLIIPTRNRPRFLFRALSYLAAEKPGFRILIADSSEPSIKEENRRVIDELRLAVTYLSEDYEEHPTMPAYTKLRAASEALETPYACVFADDDIVDVDVIRRSVLFLEENSDYSVCHGKYVGFAPHSGVYELTHIEYDGNTLESEDQSQRIAEYFLNYEAIFYAVFRSSVMETAFNFALKQRSPLFAELAVGFVTVLCGKVKRLGDVFTYRWPQIGNYDRNFFWEPASYLEGDPEGFYNNLWHFRDECVALWRTMHTPKCDMDVAEKLIVFSMLGYIYLNVDLKCLGRRNFPAPLHQCLSENLSRRPATFSFSVPSGRAFIAWVTGKIFNNLFLRLGAVGYPRRMGTVLIRADVAQGLTASDCQRARAIFQMTPYIESP